MKTTIAAAVLALNAALITGISLVPSLILVVHVFGRAHMDPSVYVALGGATLELLCLVVGAILLLVRVRAGRILVAAGATLKLVSLAVWPFFVPFSPPESAGSLVLGAAAVVLSVAAAVLALLPSTGRWIAAKSKVVSTLEG